MFNHDYHARHRDLLDDVVMVDVLKEQQYRRTIKHLIALAGTLAFGTGAFFGWMWVAA